jgi:hypothetical protein
MQFENPQELSTNDLLWDDMLYRITRSDSWYANIVNCMVARYVPLGEDKRKLIYESRHHIWSVPAKERIKIIERCQLSPYGGHYGAFCTHAKIWQSGFFWPTMYEDTKDFI